MLGELTKQFNFDVHLYFIKKTISEVHPVASTLDEPAGSIRSALLQVKCSRVPGQKRKIKVVENELNEDQNYAEREERIHPHYRTCIYIMFFRQKFLGIDYMITIASVQTE